MNLATGRTDHAHPLRIQAASSYCSRCSSASVTDTCTLDNGNGRAAIAAARLDGQRNHRNTRTRRTLIRVEQFFSTTRRPVRYNDRGIRVSLRVNLNDELCHARAVHRGTIGGLQHSQQGLRFTIRSISECTLGPKRRPEIASVSPDGGWRPCVIGGSTERTRGPLFTGTNR